ncbi:molybdopterin-binding domain-containing protein [Lacipirellula limnantheis]|uniref:Formyltransferase/hydrolase complex Fhc subunit B n=1 Tax=Lacipirellula limnantheis TaxID=2528024 RepID=A0A517U487_9BACT|nr:formylmethanofuran dehydrogenase subunit B [Lacipirellula limnantheis]QDT75415.1 Formyltransferase/hydrolase complex Fhc subunit B [Lacipirellula limnantheis]
MSQTITDYVCTACGCLCDDLTLTIEGRRIARVEPPCPVAAAFFLGERPAPPAAAMIDGQPAELEAALARAAEILQAASAPLLFGLQHATVDAQRAAVALADRLGATIDPTDAAGRSQNHAAIQTLGAVTATLGEVADRSDLIVYWNCNPAVTHPRHLERIARHPYAAPGEHPTKRRVIVVAPERNASTSLADDALTLRTDSDLASLAVVRAIAAAATPADVRIENEDQVERQTGASLAQWAYLAERLKHARYAAIFYAPDKSDPGGADPIAHSITELVRDLHRHTRAVALPLGEPGNAAGAAQVLAWQTGFPNAVNFAAGYPQSVPGESTAGAILERGEADAAIVIAADPLNPPTTALSAAAQDHLKQIPTIVLDDHATETAKLAAVAIFTPTFGIETSGEVFRSDNIALPLRAAIAPTRPTAEELMQRLLALMN